MTSTIGIPIKLLNEAQVRTYSPTHPTPFKRRRLVVLEALLTPTFSQGHVVTLEITSGQVYRGKLLEGLFSRSQNHPHALTYGALQLRTI
jgi:uncharacterized protein YwbE